MSSLLKGFLFSIGLLLLAASGANATTCTSQTGVGDDCYWRAAGTGNWNTSGNWSDTDGGGSCACTPASGANIFFTSNSGTNASTINATRTIGNFNSTGSSAVQLTHSGGVNLTVNGTTFNTSGSLTWTSGSATTAVIIFGATAGTTTITSDGQNFGNVTINGAGGTFELQDNFSVRSGATSVFTLTAGTFRANNFNVTASSFSSSNANAREITMGSGTWLLNGSSGTLLDFATATNLIVTKGTSVLTLTPNGTAVNTVNAGGKDFATVNFGANASAQSYAVTAAFTADTLNITAPIYWRQNNTTAITIANAINWDGSPTTPISFASNSVGTRFTFALTAGGVIDWGAFRDVLFTGTAPSITNGIDQGNNSGATITPPTVGGGGRCVGC